MGGAHGLQGGLLQGRLLLNLDTEEWGEFYLGCAGGLDVNVQREGRAEPAAGRLHGLAHRSARLARRTFGHRYHAERGNAIKLLVRVLRDLESRLPLRLAELSGGSARNALPREASATLAVPSGSRCPGGSPGVVAVVLRQELRASMRRWHRSRAGLGRRS
jgi:dipeptidase D